MTSHSSPNRQLSLFISGPEEIPLENKIFNTATFSLAVLTIIIAAVTLNVSSQFTVWLPLALAPFVFGTFFYYSRFRGHFRTSALFFIVFSLIFFDYIWFTVISFAPSFELVFILILTLGLTILPVKKHLLFTLACILNIMMLNWLANIKPHWIYPGEASDSLISYLSSHIFLITGLILIALVIAYFKKAYERERENAAERNRQMSNVNQGLVNRNQHLESLARMVSHNLRSPIAGMKMLLSLYERMESPEEKEDIVQNIREGAFTLFDMVEDLAAIMLDYKELNKEKEEVWVQEVCDSVLTQLSGQVKSLNAKVKLDFDSCPKVYYSRTYLESIFLNLISNALKYSSPKQRPEIEVRSYVEDNKVMVSVSDNGLGIDLSQHREQLFKMYKTFHRDAGADSKGIGLFITKNQVEMMGGKISVQSKPDEGSTFFVELYRV